MHAVAKEVPASRLLADARAEARREPVGSAGRVTPRVACALVVAGEAVLVDVRSAEEIKCVGRVPAALHVAWASGIGLSRNPDFAGELERAVARDAVVLFLCRSELRSAHAAEAATRAEYPHAYNVTEGFEGDLNFDGQRGSRGEWRHHGLPWIQD